MGRFVFLARASAARILGAQPISSKRFSSRDGWISRTFVSTDSTSLSFFSQLSAATPAPSRIAPADTIRAKVKLRMNPSSSALASSYSMGLRQISRTGRSLLRITRRQGNCTFMTFYRRLPHVCETEPSAFLTWRFHDSLPSDRAFPASTLNSGQVFAATDRLLDQARGGSLHLRQPAVADMVVEALEYTANILGNCRLPPFG